MELRDEIVESQKARCDLLKWKLALVAGLGTVGLGLGDYAPKEPGYSHHYVLCLIPLVCVYVDLLAKHMTLRIMVIGCFRGHRAAGKNGEPDSIESLYEKFAGRAREMPFPSDDSLERDLHRGNLLVRFWMRRIVSMGKRKYRMKRRRLGAYELEDWALQWSTLLLSFCVIIYGTASWLWSCAVLPLLPFLVSGILGIFLSYKLDAEYRLRLIAVGEIADNRE